MLNSMTAAGCKNLNNVVTDDKSIQPGGRGFYVNDSNRQCDEQT